MSKVDWTKELVLTLIEEYEQNPCLYNTKNKFYTNKHARNDAMNRITDLLKGICSQMEVEDVKKKITNVRQQFSHENAKIQASRKSGIGSEDVYEPTVWWYEKLLFLLPHVKCRNSKSSLDELNEDSGNEGHSESSDWQTPRAIPKKRKMDDKDSNEKIMEKTMETLDALQHKFYQPSTSANKTDSQIFGEYVASELDGIEDAEITADLKHVISNAIYEAKKKWIKLAKNKRDEAYIFEVFEDAK